MDMNMLAHGAFVVTFLFFFMYTLLDGFDLGIGAILPYMHDREKTLGAILPFWDGNEVWIVMAVGFVFAAFPPVYATLLPLFYLPILLALFAFIARAVAIEVLQHGPEQPSGWHLLLAGASLLIALAGALVTILVATGLTVTTQGIGMNLDLRLLTNPLVWLFMAGAVATIIWHGHVYLLTRNYSSFTPRLATVPGSAALLLAAAVLVLLVTTPASSAMALPVVAGSILTITGLAVSLFAQSPKIKFAASGAALAGWWLIVALLLYPKVFNPELTVEICTAPLSSLKIIVPLAIALFPVILLLTKYIFKVMGRDDDADDIVGMA